MPHFSNNNDPLLDRAVFGFDGTNYRVIKLDTSGQLVVAIAASQTIQANLHGYDGSAYHKNPLVWGYTDRWSETISNLNPGAGSITLLSTAVPSGYVYVLEAVAALNNTTNPAVIVISVTDGSTAPELFRSALPGIGVPAKFSGRITLKAGDQVRCVFAGTLAGDDLFAYVWGHKFKIND